MAKINDLLLFNKKNNIAIITIESIIDFMNENNIAFTFVSKEILA